MTKPRLMTVACLVGLLWLLLPPSLVRAQKSELRIGVLNELSGPLASLGAVCSRGNEIALRAHAPGLKLPNLEVKVFYGDEHDDAKAAVSEFQKMTQIDRIDAVIAVRSKGAMPINPLAERLGIPVVGIVGSPAFLSTNRHAVRMYATPGQEADFDVKLARHFNASRAALLISEDEYTVALGSAVRQKFVESGGSIVYYETLGEGDIDYATQLSKVRAASPDIVFLFMGARNGLVIRKLREQRIAATLMSHYWIQQPEQMKVAGNEALEGVLFSEVSSSKPKFFDAYGAAYPSESYNPAAYLCYAAMATVLEAAKHCDGSDTEALRRCITQTARAKLLDEELRFVNREAQFELVSKVFSSGKAVELSKKPPTAVSTGNSSPN